MVLWWKCIYSIKIVHSPSIGDDSRILSLDKVVIAASAIICIIVIIGALIVILLYFRKREGRNESSLSSMHPHHTNTLTAVLPPLVKQQIPAETDWETLSWNSGRSSPKNNGHNCLVGKSGSTSHSFVLNDGQFQINKAITNGFAKSFSTRDNDSRLSYSHISKVSVIFSATLITGIIELLNCTTNTTL